MMFFFPLALLYCSRKVAKVRAGVQTNDNLKDNRPLFEQHVKLGLGAFLGKAHYITDVSAN